MLLCLRIPYEYNNTWEDVNDVTHNYVGQCYTSDLTLSSQLPPQISPNFDYKYYSASTNIRCGWKMKN